MARNWKSVVALTAALMVAGCSDSSNPLLEVEYEKRPSSWVGVSFDLTYLHLTSVVDRVEVRKVEVNRGNCEILRSSLPSVLGYGQQMDIHLNNDCMPREVEVITDQGTRTFTFGR